MQLLVRHIKNKTIAPRISGDKFTTVILLLLHLLVHIIGVTAEMTCHQCRDINCLRTTYRSTQKCVNDLDICVNVFDRQTLLAQGCWEQMSDELRNKCKSQNSEQVNDCFKCNENLCNNLSSSSFECIQCDSDSDDNLLPSRCAISRTSNLYCFVRQEGNRVIRGCTDTLESQMSCLNSENCTICQPSELRGCNSIEIIKDNTGLDGEHTEDNGSESNSGSGNGRTCHQCSGINCLRTAYNATQKCLNDLDICVTVFDEQTVLVQGCWEQLSEEERNKCVSDGQCLKCNENLCNDLASSSFECIQCDSYSDDNCRVNPAALAPSGCGISRTPNEYCFAKQEGDRVIRGCSHTLEDQIACLASDNCLICQHSELTGCNSMNVVNDDNDHGGNSENSSDNDAGNNGTGPGGSDSENGDSGGVVSEDDGTNNDDSSVNGENNGNTSDGENDSGNGGSGEGSGSCSTSTLNIFLLINAVILILLRS